MSPEGCLEQNNCLPWREVALDPLKDNPEILHPQGQLWAVNSTWEVLWTDPIKCSEVGAASTSLNFTTTALCSHSHVRFWVPRGLWDALLQSETKARLAELVVTALRARPSTPSEILLGYNQQKAFRTACLCHMVRIVLIYGSGIFNVLEETKVRCYIVLFEKNSLIKALLQNIHQEMTLCDKFSLSS